MPIGLFPRTMRGRKIWYCQVMSNGKLVTKSTGCTDRGLAIQRAGEIQEALRLQDKGLAPGYLHESDAIHLYLDWAENHQKLKTVTMDKIWWRKFWDWAELQGKNGNIYALSVGDVVAFQQHMAKEKSQRGKPYSPVSINTCQRHLCAILSRLTTLGHYSGQNPFLSRYTGRQRTLKPKPKFLSLSQYKRLLGASRSTGRDLYLFVALAGLAGLRKKEALNLRWKDIDFARASQEGEKVGAITVWEDAEHGVKTDGSNRIVPIHPSLYPILQEHRPVGVDCRWSYVIAPHKTTCCPNGYRWDPSTQLIEVSNRVLKKRVNPHMLRHTFASLLAQAGVSIYKIKGWLGHSSITTTEIYAHLSPVDSEIGRMG